MKTMILAAGLGERMRPLTDATPKPLLRVAGIPLIEHQIRRLVFADLRDLVINVSHLAEQIESYCGDGARWGARITYSREERPLETAGGIQHAMPLLGDQPFLVVNGDVWTDFPFRQMVDRPLAEGELVRLLLVDNPEQHPMGDFSLNKGKIAHRPIEQSGFTYAGIGLYHPRMFAGLAAGKMPLRPLLDEAIDRGQLGGQYYRGDWEDVGTPERLADLDARIQESAGGTR